MTYTSNEIFTDVSSGGSSEKRSASAVESREVYEKPTLDVVKFMFESDITWGSFEEGQGGDNEFSGDDDWWN